MVKRKRSGAGAVTITLAAALRTGDKAALARLLQPAAADCAQLATLAAYLTQLQDAVQAQRARLAQLRDGQ